MTDHDSADHNAQGVTVIRKCRWLVGWDVPSHAHIYLEDADLVFSNAGVLQVGGRWSGPASREIAGEHLMVMPGLVNIHCHSGDEPLAKGLFDDVGTAALWGNALYEYAALIDSDDDAKAACQTVMLNELLCSGVTTALDIASWHPRWLDLMARSGIRGYAAPGFRQAAWRMVGSHRLEYDWDDTLGRERYAQALEIVDAAQAHACGRLAGVIAPSQVETVREDLLVEAAEAAGARGMPLTIHAAQTMAEHEELLRRTGKTAVQFLDGLGVLGERLILGHAIFLDHHSWTRQRSRDDLPLLAARGTSVAHCPVTFARSGMALETLGAYQRAGVNVGIGTDTCPFNMLEEMRQALILARMGARQVFEIDTAGVFNAATTGSAKALGRDDIGRLVVGAKADLVLVDLRHPQMQPVHDPLRSLLHCAAERAVRDVFVDGHQVVRDGKALGLDHAGATAMLADAQARAIRRAEADDPQKRSIAQLAPLTFRTAS